MLKPSKKNIRKWVDALRSGEYKQTTGSLHDADGYCCLGVACKVFIPAEKLKKDEDGCIHGFMPLDQNYAPRWLTFINKDFDRLTEAELTALNDECEFSFDEIADLLQAVYIEKVLEG